MLDVAVLASGRGSNLQALLDAQDRKDLGPARVRVVVSDVPAAPALERARQAGVEALAIPPRPSRPAHEDEIVATLQKRGIGLVALAGYMRILTPRFVHAFPNRVINIHPALLPAFPGLHAQRQAWEHGARLAGCTVHFVDEQVDAGPIIAQAALTVDPAWSAEELATQILKLEHETYPRVVRWIAEGRVQLEGRRVIVKGAPTDARTIRNPGDPQ